MREKPTPRDVMNASEKLVLMTGDLLRQNSQELQEIQASVIDRLAGREIPRGSGGLDTSAAELVHEMLPQILNDSALREPVRKLLARAEQVIESRASAVQPVRLPVTRELAKLPTAGAIAGAAGVGILGGLAVSFIIYGAIRHYQCVQYKDC